MFSMFIVWVFVGWMLFVVLFVTLRLFVVSLSVRPSLAFFRSCMIVSVLVLYTLFTCVVLDIV